MRIVARKFDAKCEQESIMLKEIHKFASETSRPIAIWKAHGNAHTDR